MDSLADPYMAPTPRRGRATSRRRFPLVPFGDIKLGTDRHYLVKGLIPREGLVVVWGPPKCGKSFWIFDLVMHVALGWPYRGRRVQQGAIVYVACEGERGIAARTEAFRRGKMSEQSGAEPFYLLATHLDLAADAKALIADIQAQIGHIPSAVILDTLNRSIGGSESDDRDMGDYVKAADLIRETFHCAVVLIHHCGIDGTRPRGHTSLTGAADAQIAVKRDAGDYIHTVVEWMKDGPEGEETRSRLETIEVGIDEDGEPITSCTVQEADGAESLGSSKRRAPTGAARLGLEKLHECIVDRGRTPPVSDKIPGGRHMRHIDRLARLSRQGGDNQPRRELPRAVPPHSCDA